MSLVNTSPRPMDSVLLREFIPIDDVATAAGIDDAQETNKFFTWDELL